MDEWLLGIELNGEWEACCFHTQAEAMRTFEALRSDYPQQLLRAVLVPRTVVPRLVAEPGLNRRSKLIH